MKQNLVQSPIAANKKQSTSQKINNFLFSDFNKLIKVPDRGKLKSLKAIYKI